MIGNVAEFVADAADSEASPARAGDGLREAAEGAVHCMLMGSSSASSQWSWSSLKVGADQRSRLYGARPARALRQ
jgi:hypothetical protein